jgi:glycosyltransferase involved in cell wall biosynthesis
VTPSGAGGASPVTSVSAFFPCYNDAATIAKMVLDVDRALATHLVDYEIIVVDDGSTDDSARVLDELALRTSHLVVIHHERNRGYGGALITGFGAATKEWIFYTDGDGQYDATEAPLLLHAASADSDVVQGWKIARGDAWYRKVIGRVYHHTVRTMFRLHVRDTDCDFRLFRRVLVVDPPLTSTSGVICVEMMRRFERAGARFVEVPVHHYFRPAGRSQFFRIPAIARSARQLLRLWWRLMIRRDEPPRTSLVATRAISPPPPRPASARRPA